MEKVKTNTRAETLSWMFQFQTSIYHNALESLTDQEALKRVLDKSNHINWLLGHILHCRYMLANMIGVEAENPFGKMYWDKLEDIDYPGIKEIVSNFPVITEILIEKLSSISDVEMDAKLSPEKPSLTEIISFFVYHEAYHIGQLGITRKLIGLEVLKSN